MTLFEKSHAQRQQRQRENVLKALDRLTAAVPEARPQLMAQLIDRLRPQRTRNGEAEQRLDWVIEQVRSDEQVRAALSETLRGLLLERQPARLLSESGILANEGLIGGFWRRMMQKLLPEDLRADQLKDQLNLLFHERSDHLWVEATPDVRWIELLDALDFSLSPSPVGPGAAMPILEALQVLSYRIAALGLEPELIRNEPAIERYKSPFMTQNVELHEFIAARLDAATEKKPPALDDKQLLVLLGQCETILARVRKQAAKSGASVSLTIVLVRLAQSIERLRMLLQLLEDAPAHELNVLRVRLFKMLVRSENNRNSVGELWSQTVDLLALRITENAGQTGEHYITTSRSEYFAMLRSALGAGFVIAFMAMLKIDLSMSEHAPLATAFLYSMNYGLGFVLVYMLGFTIATKQPAMTASRLAAALSRESGKVRLDALADLIVSTIRSQFIAITGNVITAFSVPVLLGCLVYTYTGEHFITPQEAHHLLDDQNPLLSLAWLHAAIAGVCLFLSGLISGYFDNKAVYGRIRQRLLQRPGLRRLLGEAYTQRLAAYVEQHLGGLAGNFFFGCMLGSMGVIGFILGLPLNIRHVTFSSSYFGFSLVALDWHVPAATIALVALGVAGIGVINLMVSFSLALYVALRAQHVHVTDTRALLLQLGKRFLRSPREFFWPPRKSRPIAAAVRDE
ncbi:MAG: site-specific recombinase [Stenotrophobium sp.]